MVQQQQQTGGNTVAPKEVDYGYNAIGQFTAVSDYNIISGPRTDVLTGTYSYDNGARLTGLAYTSDAGQTTIDTLGWGYDAANNVTSFSSIDGTATYGYDPTNQLTSATYTTSPGGRQPGNESYSFDSNGNRTNTGYSTGSDNEMTSDGTFNYQHDADGNTTVRTRISDAYATDYRTVYTWDYRNRLTDVEFYDNNSVLTQHVHFVYDVFDHLLATEVDTTGDGTYDSVQHYVLDVSPEIPSAGVPGTGLAQPDFAFDSYGNVIQRDLVALDPAGVDAVMAQEMVNQGDAVTWLADNNLGSPVDVVNSSGVSANHIVYAAFGQEVYESNNDAIHWAGFAGGHEDPNTGLVNDYHRWYDPATGRWLSQDPSGFAAGDANLDRVVHNSPVMIRDLTGLQEEGGGGEQPNYLIGPDGLPINIVAPSFVVFEYDLAMNQMKIMRDEAETARREFELAQKSAETDQMFLGAIRQLQAQGTSDRSIKMLLGITDVNRFEAALEADIAVLNVKTVKAQLKITATADAEMRIGEKIEQFLGMRGGTTW